MTATIAERVWMRLQQSPATAAEVVRDTGLSQQAVWTAYRDLRKGGYIELVATSGRSRVYRVVKMPERVGGIDDGYGAEPCELAKVWK